MTACPHPSNTQHSSSLTHCPILNMTHASQTALSSTCLIPDTPLCPCPHTSNTQHTSSVTHACTALSLSFKHSTLLRPHPLNTQHSLSLTHSPVLIPQTLNRPPLSHYPSLTNCPVLIPPTLPCLHSSHTAISLSLTHCHVLIAHTLPCPHSSNTAMSSFLKHSR